MLPDTAADAASREIMIEVLRYRSETDLRPAWRVYRVPFTDDMSVLQGLQYIKDHLDGTLSFQLVLPDGDLRQLRHDVDAEPKLACMTFLRHYTRARFTVEPLAHFPIERDLVVSVDGFIKKIESIYPYSIPKTPRRPGKVDICKLRRSLHDTSRSVTASIACCVMRLARQSGENPNLAGSWRDGAAAAVQRQLAGWRTGEAYGTRAHGKWRLELYGRRLLLRGMPQASRSR